MESWKKDKVMDNLIFVEQSLMVLSKSEKCPENIQLLVEKLQQATGKSVLMLLDMFTEEEIKEEKVVIKEE